MKTDLVWKVLVVVLGLLFGILAYLGKAVLEEQAEQRVQLALMDERLQKALEANADDARQDRSIQQHWALHSWERDQINELRVEAGMRLATWPDLP